MKTVVVINCHGGLVQDVASNNPDVEVHIVDWDQFNDGGEPEPAMWEEPPCTLEAYQAACSQSSSAEDQHPQFWQLINSLVDRQKPTRIVLDYCVSEEGWDAVADFVEEAMDKADNDEKLTTMSFLPTYLREGMESLADDSELPEEIDDALPYADFRIISDEILLKLENKELSF